MVQLLESYEDEMNPKELVELTQQEEEVIAPKELTAKQLTTYLKYLDKLIQEGIDMDFCMEHSLQTGRKIESSVAAYRELYRNNSENS